MDYESSDFSDILGSNTLPVRQQPPAKWSGFSKTAFFFVLLLAAYVGAVRAWDALLKWREKSYRLSMRRQHGIPDNDHRPFNVAYAAVLRARREEEVANNRVHRVDVDELYAEADRRAAPVESDIRQRNPYRTSEPAWPSNVPVNGLPGRFNPLAPDNRYMASSSGLPPSSSYTTNFAERYNPKPNPAPAAPVVRFADEIQTTSSSRRGSLNNVNNHNSSPRKHQKRALEEYDVEPGVPENPKKTRVEGDEFIDGDEDAEWLPRQKRGEKRVMREDDLDEEDEGASPPGRRMRGKRARKVALEQQDVFMASDDNADDDMDVDNEEWRESRAAIARGKKRDAGSSFGGEEEAEGSEQAQKTKRKRRARKSDGVTQVPSRGQKRDRDVDEGSDAEASPGTPARNTRKTKKRGKKSKEVQDEDEEGSVDEGSVSKGKGRPIGDQWESNGVLYKIGPNGQRLRQALVKKAARRFTMPLDSQHPDRNANLEVCIETWLTEEEYKDLKSQHLLAWQDSPKGTQEPESMPSTPAAPEAPATPTPTVAKGKNLLWDSPASPFPVFAPSPAVDKEQLRPKAHFRQSIAADVGMRVNPFDKANALHVGAELATKTGLRNGRRVVAVRETGANASGLADSTNSIAAPPLRRTFSKWEKQDLEAKAMMKMREANQAKVKERELKERLEKEKKEREATAAAAAAAPIPTISLTKPPTEASKPPAISFAPPTPIPGAAPSSGASTPSFTLGGSTPVAAPTQKAVTFAPPPDKPQPPNLFTPVAPAGGAAPTSSIPNPFAKPALPQSAPAPAPAPAAANSNPFAPSAATPASNPFAPSPSGPSASSNNNSAATTSKPSFSFSPAAGGATTTKTSMFAPSAGAKPSVPAASSNNASGAPSFSFAPPAAAAQQQNPSQAQTQSSGAGSLLSRMGVPAPAQTTASNPTRPDAAPPTFSFKPAEKSSPFGAPAQQQQAKPAESAFSFKPAAPATTSAFAPPAQQQQQQQQQQQPASGAPKFTFAAAKPPAAPSTTSSSLTGALGTSDAKPAPTPSGSAFSFAKPAAPAPEKQQTQTATFNFSPSGAPGAGFGAGFGANAATPAPTPGAAPGEGEKKPTGFGFNFGATGGATTSAFGGSGFGGAGNNTAAATAPSSAFGGGAKPQSAFGGFGGAAKPAEETAKMTTPAFGAPAATTTTTNPTPAPAFSFGFGGANNNTASTTPAASPAAAATSNPFGGKPSAFGSSITPAGSPFGTPSAFGSKPAAGSVFGAGASPFGTPPATGASSPFGNPGAGTPSAFGFGTAQK
ncbi:hypothetical protein B0H16DRAFT_1014390 [Mycena metata]|uniref:Uncharacterized protein n=1 Tax=Mycena metata TaxID=1033252 RepID=A0AAD7IJA2_9AGAR|nr:hypothetical protein B0H16DRAFT_1014390 [Mycena metata]